MQDCKLPFLKNPKNARYNAPTAKYQIQCQVTYQRVVRRQNPPSKLQHLFLQYPRFLLPPKFRVRLCKVVHGLV
jgi:hypothetical protein